VLYTANYMAVSAFSAIDGSPLWQSKALIN
jgi:hypothetical protein